MGIGFLFYGLVFASQEYFSNYTQEKIVLTMGVNNLVEIFDEKYYSHLSGGILEAFGKLFYKNLRIFLNNFHLEFSSG